eukprot:TRINITY_DN2181_c0_g1_i5.p1 TRINITY_DN2181_c0_g1~~TRINITY_DN2181_c0_g1_i5.p1  ORF type:complete len:768 (-),score=193.28 TRINITY_DN2181_c0_g1_i5:190-2385(-)
MAPESNGAGMSSKKSDQKQIMELVLNRPNFHDRRELAKERPERARDKLNGYAVLDLKIVGARNLAAKDSLTGRSDPYVEVYLDDAYREKTNTVMASLDPEWNWEYKMEIRLPGSYVLLHVKDWDFHKLGSVTGFEDDSIGFVEIPISDLPPGETITGWFILSPHEKLEYTAPDRMKALKECRKDPEEVVGALRLEITLNILSGDPTDEDYAWYLPSPVFTSYPEGGVRPRLDAQALVDALTDVQTTLLTFLLKPMLSFVFYVLSWREPPLSGGLLALFLFSWLFPRYYLTVWLTLPGAILLALKDPQRRHRVTAHPRIVALNDEGFRKVASTHSTEDMFVFVSRVVTAMNGKVADRARLKEFAAFASRNGLPNTDYAGLKRQLRDCSSKSVEVLQAAAIKKRSEDLDFSKGVQGGDFLKKNAEETDKLLNDVGVTAGEIVGTTASVAKGATEETSKVTKSMTKQVAKGQLPVLEKPCVTFSGTPLASGALVRQGLTKCEVVSCQNSDNLLNWRYVVKIPNEKDPEKTKEREVLGDELEARVDVRWASSSAVLAILPNSVEDMLMGFLPLTKNMSTKLIGMCEKLTTIIAWEDEALAKKIAGGSLGGAVVAFFLVSLLNWIICLGLCGAIGYLFVMKTEHMVAKNLKKRGLAEQQKHKEKNPWSSWPFFIEENGPSSARANTGLRSTAAGRAADALLKSVPLASLSGGGTGTGTDKDQPAYCSCWARPEKEE